MSEFWKRKMRTFVALFDYDKDGVIRKEDWDKIPALFANFENADKSKTEHLKTQFNNLWNQFMKKSDSADKNVLTAEVLAESVSRQRDDPELPECLSDVVRSLLDLLDVSCDGFLQEDEHRRLVHQLGVPDTSYTKDTFQALDVDHDGKLRMDEFIAGSWEFFVSEDENNPNTLRFGPLVA